MGPLKLCTYPIARCRAIIRVVTYKGCHNSDQQASIRKSEWWKSDSQLVKHPENWIRVVFAGGWVVGFLRWKMTVH